MPGTLGAFEDFYVLMTKSLGYCFCPLTYSQFIPFSEFWYPDNESSTTLLRSFFEFLSLSNRDLLIDFPYSLKTYFKFPSLSGVKLQYCFYLELV